jgi:hypothetical protein
VPFLFSKIGKAKHEVSNIVAKIMKIKINKDFFAVLKVVVSATYVKFGQICDIS